MAYNSNLEQAMNSISLEDEEEGVFELENEVLGENTPLAQGFNAKLCVVGRFITEGRVDFAAMQHSLAALWKPEHEIVKPYGSWMRAPLKRQVKPIGAKWLRNGNEDSSSSSVHGDRHKQLGEEDANHDPKSTPENMTAVGQGENQGDMVFQNLNQGAGISENTFQTNTATSAVNKDKEDTVIIELKKRKTDDGFDASSSMGQHRDIIMGLEDEFTNGMEHADAGNNKDPKNLYGAGTQGGTRLAL
ncbi:hypothetical protein ACET3Z_028954 [Daucus carota]